MLAVLGDSVTTDHISPAGAIKKDSPAAKYLNEHGVENKDFNSYGSRRGNHEVMMRGTFANIRLRNYIAGKELVGGTTLYDGEELPIYDAAMKYAEQGTPLVVLAGDEYGSGSSRDWAAKGTRLLGVRAVIAESFERIHRSNLVGMGVLPLQFAEGDSVESLGLTGEEEFSIAGVDGGEAKEVTVRAGDKEFTARVRIDTPKEVDYFKHGGILQYVLRGLVDARVTCPAPCRLTETLRRLLTAPGPSGYEQAAAAVFREAAGAFAEITHDTVGSTVARVKGTGDGPLVAVVGHIDEIGLIVHHIDDDGYLWFTGVGGWDPVILVGQRVEVATRGGGDPRRGRQEADPPAQGGGSQAGARAARTCTSTSARRTATRRAALVRIGDVAVIAGEPVELPNDRVISRSMDNRLGCYVALEAARLVAEAGDAAGDVAAVAVTQEEITFGGARTTAYSLRARHRDRGRRDVRDRRSRASTRRSSAATSSAPARCSRAARRSHPLVFELLREAGEAEGIPFTVAASARATGTDADAFHISRAGIPTGGRVGPAALHALAGRDGPARRRRQRRQADRRVRAPARARPGPSPLKPAPAPVRHRRHAAERRRRRARAGAARGGGERCTACLRSTATSRSPGAPTRRSCATS